MLIDVRCSRCSKLLAKATFVHIEIKCPRCGAFNSLRAKSPLPERQRAPAKGQPLEQSAQTAGQERLPL